MEITTQMIKDLRQATGAGVLDCRKTLEDCGGDFEAATQLLREKGLAAVAERSERVASEGLIEAYVHPGSRVGVLLELNCETDFVARTDDFKSLAHDLTLHIAFAAPKYVDREQVPADVLEAESALLSARNALVSAVVKYRLAGLALRRDLSALELSEEGLWRDPLD